MSWLRALKWPLLSVLPLLASACSQLGDGSRPESLEITRDASSVLLGTHSKKAFVCFVDQLRAIATDTDGRLGSFTSRVIWTSSNPAVAEISNGDIPLPSDDTQAYAPGVVIPKAAGTTTITAQFASLSATYELVVEEPGAISIAEPAVMLAPLSNRLLELRAMVGGYERDVTALALWSFDEAADGTDVSDTAVIGESNGSITAGTVAGSLTARASLVACPAGSSTAALAENLTAAVTVQPLSSLSVSREFEVEGEAPPLVVGTTEAFTVTGHFDGTDETQDLSRQISFDTSDTAIAGPTSPVNIILASAAGSVTVTPRYPAVDNDDVDTVTGPVSTVDTIERTFASFVITPDAVTIAPFDEQQFRAIATYEDGATQDITRHVLWESSDLDIAPIGTSYLLAGLATSSQAEDGSVTITATRGTGDSAVEVTAELSIAVPQP